MASASVPNSGSPSGPQAAGASGPAPPAAFPHPLRERNFRMWWAGQAISLLGDQCYLVALPWLVLQMTGSAVAMSTILMAAAVPRTVLMLIGGALTDRVSPRKVMITTASARTVLVAAIGFLVWFHRLGLWELYVLAFAFGTADAFAYPASGAFTPSLIRREQMVAASSTMQSTLQFTSIAGPAPAGIMIKTVGTAWAFFLDAISFLFIIAALWRLPDPPKPPAARKPMWHSIKDGIGYVIQDVPLRSFVLLATILNFCMAGPMGVGLPYLAKTKFGSPTAYGLLVASAAVGGLLGALLAGLWRVRRRGWLILGTCGTLGILIGPIGLAPRLWMIAALLLLIGLTAGVANVHIVAWIQQRIALEVRGRVMSVLMLALIGLMPVSLAAAGALVAWSLPGMFLLSGALVIVVCGFGALQKPVREIA
jgi:MFS family permease